MIKSLRYKCICIFCCLIFLLNLYSYGFQSIRYLGIEKGLSNNAVTSIYKDRYGFMRMGAFDDLNKFDGSKNILQYIGR